MVPITKVSKLLGEILFILKHLFSWIFPPLLQGSGMLKQDRGDGPPSPKFPSSLKFMDANFRVQIPIKRFSTVPNYSHWAFLEARVVLDRVDSQKN